MRELIASIPDYEVLVALQPEELGSKLLFILKANQQREKQLLHMQQVVSDHLFQSNHGEPVYPRAKREEILIALSEAWDWLEREGMVIPEMSQSTTSGWRRFSRRADKISNEQDLVHYAMARRIPRDSLHIRIRETVWMAFVRGEFDVAVFQAMKSVEVAVREAAGLTNSSYGRALMQEAFRADRYDNGA